MKLLHFTILCIVAATANARSVKPDTFIANGQHSENVRFYVYLEIFSNNNFAGPMFFGGGSLITTSLVLTVAQNVYEFNSWRAGLGSNHIPYMAWFNSAWSVVHPDYNPDNLSHNIAIIGLATPTPDNSTIGPVALIGAGAVFPGEGVDIRVYGFGFGGGEQNQQPRYLQTLSVVVTTQQFCEQQYPHLHNTSLLSHHFCARNNLIPLSNICAGDQGGPAFSEIVNALVGIQSFYRQENCILEEAQPSAFIRVAPYANWINGVFQYAYNLDSHHTIQEHNRN